MLIMNWSDLIRKAAARHGLGLYIYAGEDLPSEEKEKQIDEIGAVCLEVADAKDMQELQDTYYKYEKKFKNNKYFINAVNQRKSELEAA